MFLTSVFCIIFLFYLSFGLFAMCFRITKNINHDLPSLSVYNVKARGGEHFEVCRERIRDKNVHSTVQYVFNFGFIGKENLTVNLK